MTDLYEIRILNPEKLYFSRGKGGTLQGVIEGKPYDELMVYRTFPFLYTSEYISVRNSKDEELGIIRDVGELGEESAAEITQELQFRYFLPKVTHIDSVKSKSDLWLWELQTHLGPTRLVMRNLHDHIQYPGGNRILLTDMNGKRCEITDWKALDARSRKQLEEIL